MRVTRKETPYTVRPVLSRMCGLQRWSRYRSDACISWSSSLSLGLSVCDAAKRRSGQTHLRSSVSASRSFTKRSLKIAQIQGSCGYSMGEGAVGIPSLQTQGCESMHLCSEYAYLSTLRCERISASSLCSRASYSDILCL